MNMILIPIGAFLFLLLVGVPWLWGLADMLGCKRFAQRPEIDYTAAILHWWEIKALYATQSRAMVKIFPWLAMDLSEDRQVTDEDDRIT